MSDLNGNLVKYKTKSEFIKDGRPRLVELSKEYLAYIVFSCTSIEDQKM